MEDIYVDPALLTPENAERVLREINDAIHSAKLPRHCRKEGPHFHILTRSIDDFEYVLRGVFGVASPAGKLVGAAREAAQVFGVEIIASPRCPGDRVLVVRGTQLLAVVKLWTESKDRNS